MNKQVLDDNLLLDEMMSDIKKADALYRPTDYWLNCQRVFMPELKRKGLKDFRRRHHSILGSFSAVDLLVEPTLRVQTKFPGSRWLSRMLTGMIQRVPLISLGISEFEPHWLTPYFYHHTQEKFERTRFRLKDCPTSRWGNPEDLATLDGQDYTQRYLEYASVFADAARYIEFKDNAVICELGPGIGRNVEIMAKLLPKATILHFDIPPQLYVANQYLSSVFGSRVVPYREAIRLNPKPGALASEFQSKIIILPSWQMPQWSKTKIDVFWNSAAFQEMEPHVVRNYVNLVISMQTDWIYINALPQGQTGTKEPVKESLYLELFKSDFDLVASYPTDFFLRPLDYKSWIFKRKSL